MSKQTFLWAHKALSSAINLKRYNPEVCNCSTGKQCACQMAVKHPYKIMSARVWQASMMSHDLIPRALNFFPPKFCQLLSPLLDLCLPTCAYEEAQGSFGLLVLLGGSVAELDVGSRRNWFWL